MNSYVYVVFRPDGRPMYIGKGTGSRWARHSSRGRANPHYNAILAQGKELPVVILADGLTEKEAFTTEFLFTQTLGLEDEGGVLINCGHGGRGGPSGVKRSDDWKKTRSIRAQEVWQRPDYRARILRSDRNRSGNTQPRSEAFKTALSERLKGNTYTLGFHHREESKLAMSVARKGIKKTAEHRAKIGAAHRGMKRSHEALINMREAQFVLAEYHQGDVLDFIASVAA